MQIISLKRLALSLAVAVGVAAGSASTPLAGTATAQSVGNLAPFDLVLWELSPEMCGDPDSGTYCPPSCNAVSLWASLIPVRRPVVPPVAILPPPFTPPAVVPPIGPPVSSWPKGNYRVDVELRDPVTGMVHPSTVVLRRSVELFYGGPSRSPISILDLEHVRFLWTPPDDPLTSSFTNTYTLLIDPDNAFAEPDETNNSIRFTGRCVR